MSVGWQELVAVLVLVLLLFGPAVAVFFGGYMTGRAKERYDATHRGTGAGATPETDSAVAATDAAADAAEAPESAEEIAEERLESALEAWESGEDEDA